jgi:hypothetical protein
MKGILIKKKDHYNNKEIYYSLIINDECIGTTHNVFNKEMKDSNENVVFNKLSKQNCDEIFGVVDVEKLAMDWRESTGYHDADSYSYILGFNKAMELNKDKVFTLEQMSVAYNTNRSGTLFEQLINSFGGQPTEIEVTFNPDEKDSEGQLILKKI